MEMRRRCRGHARSAIFQGRTTCRGGLKGALGIHVNLEGSGARTVGLRLHQQKLLVAKLLQVLEILLQVLEILLLLLAQIRPVLCAQPLLLQLILHLFDPRLTVADLPLAGRYVSLNSCLGTLTNPHTKRSDHNEFARELGLQTGGMRMRSAPVDRSGIRSSLTEHSSVSKRYSRSQSALRMRSAHNPRLRDPMGSKSSGLWRHGSLWHLQRSGKRVCHDTSIR